MTILEFIFISVIVTLSLCIFFLWVDYKILSKQRPYLILTELDKKVDETIINKCYNKSFINITLTCSDDNLNIVVTDNDGARDIQKIPVKNLENCTFDISYNKSKL